MQSSFLHNFLLNIITINLKRKEIYVSIMECRDNSSKQILDNFEETF